MLFRSKQGGIVRREFDDPEQAAELGEDMETFVYENDLWVKQVLDDPDGGETVHMVHIVPTGTEGKRVIEFMIPMEEVAKRDRLQGTLAYHGVHGAVRLATATMLQQYIQAWVAKLKREQPTCFARSNYGWHNDTFVLGMREYIPQKPPVYSPPSKATEHSADAFTPSGELTVWREMVNLYNTPGNEVRAFVLFLSFGAPLYKFTNQGSAIVHLTNKDSGVGKSTNQRVAASVWGNPRALMLLKTDTENARYHQMGVLSNLPVIIDEITNMDGEELSELAFRVSENRGKHRMYSHSNSARKNTTKWQTIVITSGNNSLYSTLRQHKINMGGEMNRIIELPLAVKDTLTIEEASYWYDRVLPDNYGTAGSVYAQRLVDCQEQISVQTYQAYEDYVKKFNFKQEHRFFRAVCAAAFTGARLAKECGLHDIDIDRVEQWAIQQLGGIQMAVKEASSQDSVAVMGQFLNQHKRNELVINAGKVVAGGLELDQAALKEPMGQLMVRVEKDTGLMFIAKSALSAWCGEHRVHFEVLMDDLEKSKILISKSANKRLAENTSSPGIPVKCIVVDLSAVEKLKLEQALAVALDAPERLQ